MTASLLTPTATTLVGVISPAVGAVGVLAVGVVKISDRQRLRVRWMLAVLAAVVALLAAVGEAVSGWERAPGAPGIRIPLGIAVDLGDPHVGNLQLWLRSDALSVAVAPMVALVAAAVVVYSYGYLSVDRDPVERTSSRVGGYLTGVLLFTAAMQLVVHAGDLLVLVVGWEVMGACSAVQIAFHRRPGSVRAAGLALGVTRAADVGLILAVVWWWAATGTVTWAAEPAATLNTPTATAMAVLLGVSVLAKSAQIPWQGWLPVAMVGPTPVSALIHAATMVAAGTVVLTRAQPLLQRAPLAVAAMGLLIGVTMVTAAVLAVVQRDLKAVLAWSTISQIAIMLTGAVLAPGAGSDGTAGVAHLTQHAPVKALLFLVVGWLATQYGVTSVVGVGRWRHRHRPMAVAVTVGLVALAAVPPLGLWWSKDLVASTAHDYAQGGAAGVWVGWWLVGCLLLTSMLTAVYAGRLWVLLLVQPAADSAVHAPVETLWRRMSTVMPIAALTVVSVLAVLGLRAPAFAHEQLRWTFAVFATVAVATGLALVGWAWLRGMADVAVPVRRWLRVLPGITMVQRALTWAPAAAPTATSQAVRTPGWFGGVYSRFAAAVALLDERVLAAYPRALVAGVRCLGRAACQVRSAPAGVYVAWIAAGAVVVVLVGVRWS